MKCVYTPNTGTYQIHVRGDIPSMRLCSPDSDAEDAVISVDSWGDIEWKTMHKFAADCKALNIIPNEAPNLSQVKDMSSMFKGAQSFNQPLEKWNVSNVTNMSYMFLGASAFDQPLDNWKITHVTDMESMFMEADKFNQPLNHWDVSNVTNMNMMFKDATSFKQSLDNWDVSKVNNMREMFYGASQFSYYPSNWVVPKGSDGDMFKKSGVEAIAKKNPLKKAKRTEN